MDLSPGGGLQLVLAVESFNIFIFVLMDLAIFSFLNFSAQAGFQLDEWHWYYYAALKKVLVTMHKYKRPRQIRILY